MHVQQNPTVSVENDNLRRLATIASIGVACILILTKIIAFYVTDSVALLSSMIDSAVDILASIVAAVGVAHAMAPPDSEHRYGHGKAEPLSAMAQGAFIIGSSLLLTIEAVGRFAAPRPVENAPVGYIVMGLAIVLTFLLLLFQKYVIRRTGSIAIDSDRLHYTGDILMNLSVIASLAIQSYIHVSWIDPLFALFIAGTMLRGAFTIMKRALDVLMDRELSEDERKKIKDIVLGTYGVMGVHDLRTRTDSGRIFMELHVELDPDLSLRRAHDITEKVEQRIRDDYPSADITIHQDPAGYNEARLDHVIEAAQNTDAPPVKA